MKKLLSAIIVVGCSLRLGAAPMQPWMIQAMSTWRLTAGMLMLSLM